MSGHSKWSTIKRQKGAADVKRGAAFTKLGNAITIAVREGGGGDPDMNFKLRLAIEKAREANMPKDTIIRSIDRGLGKGEEKILEGALYEGFGPAGVAIIVETISDNNTRTSSEIRAIFSKGGGNMGTPGSVSYLFNRVGEIEAADGQSGETVFEKAVEAGAEDVEGNIIYTKPNDTHQIAEKLTQAGIKIISSSLVYRPNSETMVEVADSERSEKIQNLLNTLDEHDDVQNVYSNWK